MTKLKQVLGELTGGGHIVDHDMIIKINRDPLAKHHNRRGSWPFSANFVLRHIDGIEDQAINSVSSQFAQQQALVFSLAGGALGKRTLYPCSLAVLMISRPISEK